MSYNLKALFASLKGRGEGRLGKKGMSKWKKERKMEGKGGF